MTSARRAKAAQFDTCFAVWNAMTERAEAERTRSIALQQTTAIRPPRWRVRATPSQAVAYGLDVAD